MRIEVDRNGNLVAKEIYYPLILETAEGNQVAICMRDDTFDITVVGSDKWYRANIGQGTISEL